LYRDRSWITRLNAEGASAPAGQARGLLDLCDHMHKATGGLFDPTVQVLWDAAAQGHAPDTVRHLVGWEHVALGTEIRLAPDQRITLNGIAQGWATDRVTEVLSTHGFTDALVNIGEFRAEAGDWRIGIADPFEGIVRTARLSGGAVATSSPAGDRIGTQSHIFGPHGETAQWSTVSVEARTAALADAMSTALCLAPRKLAEEMLLQPDITAITLVAPNGDMAVLR
ncbi:MAG: FAD:protein FMN transferase, partial [Pseudomonadota bacterium]